ncbi:cupredoxin family copper-binding protein [Stappia sp. F7233]|uniref:Cupredoxin family copper-binding protein n=1 Tax=Stappia albiluteola TaxID=2758565 RepID=A0A839A8K4_9HYPH|nr:cupredoxin family copper-binding protein [Stappia albiluteola]MBA5775890.1 cupredoxin family copper-binding protein [Stappia albiluteola]
MLRIRKIGGALLGAIILLTAACGNGAFAGETHQVVIERFEFVPATITIRAGDAIEFVNRDIAPHTATEVEGEWDTTELAKGQASRLEFAAAGTSDYFCAFHPHMKGKVIVTPQ